MIPAVTTPQAQDAPAPDPPLVSVDIRLHESSLKVTWIHDQGGQDPPYMIDADMLKDRGNKVREKLARLVAAAREKVKEKTFGPALKELALAGRDLYQALFFDVDGTASETVRAFRHELESRSMPCRILVKVDPRIHIPWGLLYSGPTERVPDHGRIEGFEDFFCLKHYLATSYNRLSALPRPPAGAAFQLLSVINKQTFDSARGALDEEQRQVLDEMMERHGEPAYSKDEFEQRWRAAAVKFGLVYFYCHANGKTLALGANDTIDSFALRLLGNEPSDIRERVCLFFLNGCATAVGSSEGGFLEATSQRGFCGFIGTENKVPDVFALRFGTAFLHLFLTSGLPIWRVMAKLRRQHWPLSLLYGVYGQPLVRLDASVRSEPPSALVGNFCDGIVGTKDLEDFTRG